MRYFFANSFVLVWHLSGTLTCSWAARIAIDDEELTSAGARSIASNVEAIPSASVLVAGTSEVEKTASVALAEEAAWKDAKISGVSRGAGVASTIADLAEDIGEQNEGAPEDVQTLALAFVSTTPSNVTLAMRKEPVLGACVMVFVVSCSIYCCIMCAAGIPEDLDARLKKASTSSRAATLTRSTTGLPTSVTFMGAQKSSPIPPIRSTNKPTVKDSDLDEIVDLAAKLGGDFKKYPKRGKQLFNNPKMRFFAVLPMAGEQDDAVDWTHWRRGELVYWDSEEAHKNCEEVRGYVSLLNIRRVQFSPTSDEVSVGHIDEGELNELVLQFNCSLEANEWGTTFCDLLTALESKNTGMQYA